jgi:hypothetical protein
MVLQGVAERPGRKEMAVRVVAITVPMLAREAVAQAEEAAARLGRQAVTTRPTHLTAQPAEITQRQAAQLDQQELVVLAESQEVARELLVPVEAAVAASIQLPPFRLERVAMPLRPRTGIPPMASEGEAGAAVVMML